MQGDYYRRMARPVVPLVARVALALAVGTPGLVSAAQVEEVVAIVRSPAAPARRIVTLGEVEEEARIALVSRGAVLAATHPLDAPALKAGLDWLIDQILLDAEATRLQVFETDRAEAEAELDRFAREFATRTEFEGFLKRLDMSEGDLEAILRRMLRVRRYVESRVAHAAQVSEADLNAWMAAHRAEPVAKNRQAARSKLGEERVAEETLALVREVRARAEIRLIADPEDLVRSEWPEGT